MKPISFFKHSFLFILIACILLSCNTNKSFEDFTHSLFLEELSANTLNLHYILESPSEYGLDNYEISLGDYSKEGRLATVAHLESTLMELATYPYLTLTTEEKLTFQVLEDYLSTQLALSKYDLYQEPLSSSGVQMELPILLSEYEFHTEQDVKDYLALLSLTDDFFGQILDFEKEKVSAGLFMSDLQCKKVIESCESFLENKDSHYLHTSFERRIKELSFSDKKTETYMKENARLLEEVVFPTYEALIQELSQLLGSGKNEGGLCHFPSGKEYYEAIVYASTGCEDSIDTIFSRINEKRSDDLLICAQLQDNNPALLEQCAFLEWEMTDPMEMLTSLQEQILDDFPVPPESSYEINYVEEALEEYLAPAFYIIAPLDNYLENTIYINNAYVTNDLYGYTTLAHEGYPGHLYQTIMSYTYDLPEIRSILNFDGFTEGWATYIEMMSYSYAGLEEDIASILSHNQSAMLSLYASSDIGIHYYGWDLEDMYSFWGSFGITDKDAINEITQLVLSKPGNYLSYYVGYLEFLDLQNMVSASLKDDFSLMEFHRTLLDIGPAPFSIVERFFWEYYLPQT